MCFSMFISSGCVFEFEVIQMQQLRYRFPGQFWEVVRKIRVGYKYDLFGYFSRMDFTSNCR